jgi:hypothetical protein
MGKLKLVTVVLAAFGSGFTWKCYHKMVSNFLMSIESSYEYKTWNLNIPGFFMMTYLRLIFIKFHFSYSCFSFSFLIDSFFSAVKL